MDRNSAAKHDGHRKRMLQKARDTGLAFLPEHEQLEILLFAVIPRGNTNGIAIDLIRRFGSIAGVVTAKTEELMEISGIGSRAAEFLNQMPDALGIVQRSQIFGEKRHLILENAEDIGNFAISLFRHTLSEQFYMISLSYAGRVIRSDKISEGKPDDISTFIQKIARCAIMNEASAVILAHNRLGGKCLPSIEDVQMTREIAECLQILGIPVKDHIIIAGGKWISMRVEGMMTF